MISKKISLIFLLGTATIFARNSIGLNINSDDFEVEGSLDLNSFSEYTGGTVISLDANYMNTQRDNLFGFGLSANNNFAGSEGLSIGIGAKYLNFDDYSALPFMIEASYAIPIGESIPTASFSGSILYAPSVLSFDDADNYFEFRAEAAMEVISAVSLYVGYRDLEVDTVFNTTDTFNSSFYGGMKIGF